MKVLRLFLLALATFAVAAAESRPVESTHLKMIVGVTDDTAKWMTRQEGIVGVHRDLRLMAVRVTVPWKPGQVQPTKLQQVYLHRIARMVQLNDRIVLAVYNVARYAPTQPLARNQYCAFLRGVVRRIPLIHDVEIWNEANSPAYWPEDDGATAYAALLARCYDVLHSRPGPINVISSTASRHDPAAFVLDLGAAYRESTRLRPLFDTFGHNPYPENSAEPPWILHESSDLIAEGDYETLMNILQTSFEGTPQPVPGTRGVSIWYASPQSRASSTSVCSMRTGSEAGRPACSGVTGRASLRTTSSSRRSAKSADGTRTAPRSAALRRAERGARRSAETASTRRRDGDVGQRGFSISPSSAR